MKQTYLRDGGNDRLLLLFSGWGGEPALFDAPSDDGCDCMVCWDYSSLDFDAAVLARYASVRLLAWSMGVWAAAQTFAGNESVLDMKIAVGGSETPVDDACGIPEAIFRGTLERFSPVTLAKFRHRMCGTADGVKQFLARQPQRPPEDLHGELAAIAGMVASRPVRRLHWDKSIIGVRDKIFPPANLHRAWLGTPAVEVDAEHWDAGLFAALINGEGRFWTKI